MLDHIVGPKNMRSVCTADHSQLAPWLYSRAKVIVMKQVYFIRQACSANAARNVIPIVVIQINKCLKCPDGTSTHTQYLRNIIRVNASIEQCLYALTIFIHAVFTTNNMYLYFIVVYLYFIVVQVRHFRCRGVTEVLLLGFLRLMASSLFIRLI